MTLLQRLYHGGTRFDFVGNARRYFLISGTALLISVLSLGFRGLNLGVDFEGGTQVETTGNETGVSVAGIRNALEAVGQEGARIQLTGGGEGIRVQTVELSAADVEELAQVVADVAGVDRADVSTREVGPTFGSQVARSALRALIVFLIVVTVFITIRFEWRMAITALAALFHDLLLTTGVYSLVGFEVTPATVIAILTILGYSLYDTVVVFDKIEEHIEDAEERRTITGIINLSMNQVLMRSLNTSLTSLLPVGSLLFVGSFLLGATTLREFALALFVGIAAGTYSSIFFASPALALWKERQEEWKTVQRRVARKDRTRSGRTADPPVEDEASAAAARKKAERAAAAERTARAKARAARAAADKRAGTGRAKASGSAPKPKSADAEAAAAADEARPSPPSGGPAGAGARPRPPKKRRKKR